MSEVVKKIGDLPQDVQLRYQVKNLQHLVINLVAVLRGPMANFVADKPVTQVWQGPSDFALKTADTVENYLPSPKELQNMLQACVQLPDPLLSDPVNNDAKDIAKELIKKLFLVPKDFVV